MKESKEICNLRMKADDRLVLALLTTTSEMRLSYDFSSCAVMENVLESKIQYHTSLAEYSVT